MKSIQSAGGKARARALTPKRRKQIASAAAKARWSKPRDQKVEDQEYKPFVPPKVGEAQEDPQGVIAILSGPENQVRAGADFSPYAEKQQTLKEAQERRAKDALYHMVISAYCGKIVAEVIEPETSREIVRSLIQKKGFRLIIKYIGYGDQN